MFLYDGKVYVAIYNQIFTKHISTLCGQNLEFFNVKPHGMYYKSWGLKRYFQLK
jgi:hypothetical protein